MPSSMPSPGRTTGSNQTRSRTRLSMQHSTVDEQTFATPPSLSSPGRSSSTRSRCIRNMRHTRHTIGGLERPSMLTGGNVVYDMGVNEQLSELQGVSDDVERWRMESQANRALMESLQDELNRLEELKKNSLQSQQVRNQQRRSTEPVVTSAPTERIRQGVFSRAKPMLDVVPTSSSATASSSLHIVTQRDDGRQRNKSELEVDLERNLAVLKEEKQSKLSVLRLKLRSRETAVENLQETTSCQRRTLESLREELDQIRACNEEKVRQKREQVERVRGEVAAFTERIRLKKLEEKMLEKQCSRRNGGVVVDNMTNNIDGVEQPPKNEENDTIVMLMRMESERQRRKKESIQKRSSCGGGEADMSGGPEPSTRIAR